MGISIAGNPTRFANEAAFANCSGTAPVEVASADMQRHRLSGTEIGP